MSRGQADSSFYSRNRMGDAIGVTRTDQIYQNSMASSSALLRDAVVRALRQRQRDIDEPNWRGKYKTDPRRLSVAQSLSRGRRK